MHAITRSVSAYTQVCSPNDATMPMPAGLEACLFSFKARLKAMPGRSKPLLWRTQHDHCSLSLFIDYSLFPHVQLTAILAVGWTSSSSYQTSCEVFSSSTLQQPLFLRIYLDIKRGRIYLVPLLPFEMCRHSIIKHFLTFLTRLLESNENQAL